MIKTTRTRSMSFGIPMAQREPSNHATDYYFYLTNTKIFNGKNKNNLIYANVPSVTFTETHSDDLPVPSFIELPPESLSSQLLHAPLNVRVNTQPAIKCSKLIT